MRIGIALFDDVEELDWVGPLEVLASWSKHWPADNVEVVTVAATEALVVCAKGVRVLADLTWSTVETLDVLVYPGGLGTRSQLDDGDPIHGRLKSLADSGTLMTSVCTGSLVFAKAGLLHDQPATTHWAALEQLAALDPTIEIRSKDRFVDAGAVITAAGVSAGIDMALYLISRLHSTERAVQVRRVIQYDPQPPV